MKYCKNCKIKVDADRNYCPLCFRETIDDGCDSVKDEYPFEERKRNETFSKNNSFVLRLFIFMSICAVSICGIINYLTTSNFTWSLLVFASILYIWVLVCHTITSRRGAFEKVFMQLIAIMFILWTCENISITKEQHWLANYVFPSISMATVATLLMITFIRKDKSWILAFVSIIIILTAVSLVFLFYHIGHSQQFFLLSVINIVFCILSLLGYFTFGYNVIKTEFFKKFHL